MSGTTERADKVSVDNDELVWNAWAEAEFGEPSDVDAAILIDVEELEDSDDE